MTLFDDLGRSPEYEGRLGDPKFELLNRSDRAMAQRIRVTLDEWFSKYPPDGQADLRSRFRSDRPDQHLAALLELFTFTAFKRQGWRLNVHPEIPGVDHLPDFEAIRPGSESLLIECTTTNPDVYQAGADKRTFELVAGLDRIHSDQWLVLYASESVGRAALSQKWLVTQVQSWLKKLDIDEVRLSGEWPELSLNKDGWQIALYAIPAKPGLEAAGLGGLYQSETVDIVPASRIRKTIEGKAKDLRGVTRPLLLVVAANLDFVFPGSLFEALIGDRQFDFGKGFDQVERSYSHNGAWRGRNGFQREHVSAVFFARSFDAWRLADVDWQMIHHPKPAFALARHVLPFASELAWEDARISIEIPASSTVRDVFQLDADWPGPDDVQD